MEIVRRERAVGGFIHGQRRRDVEQHQTLDGIGMIERHPVSDARAAIVRAHEEFIEAEMAHDRDLIGRHRALGIRQMRGVAGRFAGRAVTAQIGRDNGEVRGELRGATLPDQMRLRMTVQKQQRRPCSSLHSENVDIAHGDAKGREILEGHGVSLVIWEFEHCRSPICPHEWDNPRKRRT